MPKFVSGSSGHIYAPDKIAKLDDDEQEDESSLVESKQQQDGTRKPQAINKKGTKEKQKNSLDLFKEELRRLAEQRETQRKKLKLSHADDDETDVTKNEPTNTNDNRKIQKPIPIPLKPDPRCPTTLTLKVNLNPKDKESSGGGSFDTGDPTTTNLYVGNLNPTINENDLCDIFGRFGPLASIKVMWPRTDEERARNRNSGFVAYMSRVDAERTLRALNGLEIRTYEMKLGWGKAVPLPQKPVYIPPELTELLKPPPPSGLPFNAQLHEDDIERGYCVPNAWPCPPSANVADLNDDEYQRAKTSFDEFTSVISRSTIRVVIPQDRETLDRIHKTIELVIREGPVFESIIIARETNNPNYMFLYDYQGHEHVYYRWKLYSLLHGDDPYLWRTEKFKMFESGPLWVPPPLNPYADGMPFELIEKLTGLNKDILMNASNNDNSNIIHSKIRPLLSDAKLELKLNDSTIKGSLGRAKNEALNSILENLDPSRSKIGSAMVFCIDHADAADEIVTSILNSLMDLETRPPKKIARLFLISDILHNCSASVTNASYYRKGFHEKLLPLFEHLHKYQSNLDDRREAERFKQKILSILGAWREWTLYEDEFIIRLSNTLLDIPQTQLVDNLQPNTTPDRSSLIDTPTSKSDVNYDYDLDGDPLDESTLVDCLEAKGLSLRWYNALELSDDDEADNEGGLSDTTPKSLKGADVITDNTGNSTADPVKFKTSKWETVDPTQVAEQVVRLSKWTT